MAVARRAMAYTLVFPLRVLHLAFERRPETRGAGSLSELEWLLWPDR